MKKKFFNIANGLVRNEKKSKIFSLKNLKEDKKYNILIQFHIVEEKISSQNFFIFKVNHEKMRVVVDKRLFLQLAAAS